MAELKWVPEQGVGEGPGEAGHGCCWCSQHINSYSCLRSLVIRGKLLAWDNTQSTHHLLYFTGVTDLLL